MALRGYGVMEVIPFIYSDTNMQDLQALKGRYTLWRCLFGYAFIR